MSLSPLGSVSRGRDVWEPFFPPLLAMIVAASSSFALSSASCQPSHWVKLQYTPCSKPRCKPDFPKTWPLGGNCSLPSSLSILLTRDLEFFNHPNWGVIGSKPSLHGLQLYASSGAFSYVQLQAILLQQLHPPLLLPLVDSHGVLCSTCTFGCCIEALMQEFHNLWTSLEQFTCPSKTIFCL